MGGVDVEMRDRCADDCFVFVAGLNDAHNAAFVAAVHHSIYGVVAIGSHRGAFSLHSLQQGGTGADAERCAFVELMAEGLGAGVVVDGHEGELEGKRATTDPIGLG